jgi:glyoxylase-like metal-dependent hydrolase (beta-lactamase superfamily II)
MINGIKVLELTVVAMGAQNTVHPVLICDRDELILVDTGYPGQLGQIRETAGNAGADLNTLGRIIITHHDNDHIGTLAGILAELPKKAEVLAHEDEKPYIQGDKRPIKLVQLLERYDFLPKEMKSICDYWSANEKKLAANVDRTLGDGELLPYCGGIEVIYTPGHTPGHISLYFKESRTLLAGDTMFVEDGRLVRAPQFVNFDNALYMDSLKKLARYDIETVICYHGGMYRDNPNRFIAELART